MENLGKMDTGSTYHIIQASSDLEVQLQENDLPNIDFLRGAILRDHFSDVITLDIDLPEGATLPHYLGHRVPIVSKLFVDALSHSVANNFELFPIKLRNSRTNKLWEDYSIFNVIGVVDAADLDASIGEVIFEHENGIDWLKFEELVLSRQATMELEMFRLASNREILLLHGRVLGVIQEKVPDAGWGFIQ